MNLPRYLRRGDGKAEVTNGTVNQRSFGLAGLALIALVMGIAYFLAAPGKDNLPVGLSKFTSEVGLPIQIWGAAWLMAGIVCMYCAIMRRPGWAAVAGVVFLSFIWAGGYSWGFVELFISDKPNRQYLLAAVYLGLGMFIMSTVPKKKATPPPTDGEVEDGGVR